MQKAKQPQVFNYFRDNDSDINNSSFSSSIGESDGDGSSSFTSNTNVKNINPFKNSPIDLQTADLNVRSASPRQLVPAPLPKFIPNKEKIPIQFPIVNRPNNIGQNIILPPIDPKNKINPLPYPQNLNLNPPEPPYPTLPVQVLNYNQPPKEINPSPNNPSDQDKINVLVDIITTMNRKSTQDNPQNQSLSDINEQKFPDTKTEEITIKHKPPFKNNPMSEEDIEDVEEITIKHKPLVAPNQFIQRPGLRDSELVPKLASRENMPSQTAIKPKPSIKPLLNPNPFIPGAKGKDVIEQKNINGNLGIKPNQFMVGPKNNSNKKNDINEITIKRKPSIKPLVPGLRNNQEEDTEITIKRKPSIKPLLPGLRNNQEEEDTEITIKRNPSIKPLVPALRNNQEEEDNEITIKRKPSIKPLLPGLKNNQEDEDTEITIKRKASIKPLLPGLRNNQEEDNEITIKRKPSLKQNQLLPTGGRGQPEHRASRENMLSQTAIRNNFNQDDNTQITIKHKPSVKQQNQFLSGGSDDSDQEEDSEIKITSKNPIKPLVKSRQLIPGVMNNTNEEEISIKRTPSNKPLVNPNQFMKELANNSEEINIKHNFPFNQKQDLKNKGNQWGETEEISIKNKYPVEPNEYNYQRNNNNKVGGDNDHARYMPGLKKVNDTEEIIIKNKTSVRPKKLVPVMGGKITQEEDTEEINRYAFRTGSGGPEREIMLSGTTIKDNKELKMQNNSISKVGFNKPFINGIPEDQEDLGVELKSPNLMMGGVQRSPDLIMKSKDETGKNQESVVGKPFGQKNPEDIVLPSGGKKIRFTSESEKQLRTQGEDITEKLNSQNEKIMHSVLYSRLLTEKCNNLTYCREVTDSEIVNVLRNIMDNFCNETAQKDISCVINNIINTIPNKSVVSDQEYKNQINYRLRGPGLKNIIFLDNSHIVEGYIGISKLNQLRKYCLNFRYIYSWDQPGYSFQENIANINLGSVISSLPISEYGFKVSRSILLQLLVAVGYLSNFDKDKESEVSNFPFVINCIAVDKNSIVPAYGKDNTYYIQTFGYIPTFVRYHTCSFYVPKYGYIGKPLKYNEEIENIYKKFLEIISIERPDLKKYYDNQTSSTLRTSDGGNILGPIQDIDFADLIIDKPDNTCNILCNNCPTSCSNKNIQTSCIGQGSDKTCTPQSTSCEVPMKKNNNFISPCDIPTREGQCTFTSNPMTSGKIMPKTYNSRDIPIKESQNKICGPREVISCENAIRQQTNKICKASEIPQPVFYEVPIRSCNQDFKYCDNSNIEQCSDEIEECILPCEKIIEERTIPESLAKKIYESYYNRVMILLNYYKALSESVNNPSNGTKILIIFSIISSYAKQMGYYSEMYPSIMKTYSTRVSTPTRESLGNYNIKNKNYVPYKEVKYPAFMIDNNGMLIGDKELLKRLSKIQIYNIQYDLCCYHEFITSMILKSNEFKIYDIDNKSICYSYPEKLELFDNAMKMLIYFETGNSITNTYEQLSRTKLPSNYNENISEIKSLLNKLDCQLRDSKLVEYINSSTITSTIEANNIYHYQYITGELKPSFVDNIVNKFKTSTGDQSWIMDNQQYYYDPYLLIESR